jgi:hypothetical protein
MTHSARSLNRAAARCAVVGAVSLVASAVGATGCLDRPLCASTSKQTAERLPEGTSGDCAPKTTNVFVDAIAQNSVDKIDLLFMIDNSISMADKQDILRRAVPDLVRRLVNPVCVNKQLPGVHREPPADIDAECPDEGFVREFNAVRDIHIGVISSSLGDHGANTCVPRTHDPREPHMDEQYNDGARLVGARPRALGGWPGIPSLGLADRAEGTPGFLRWFAPSDQPTPDIDGFSDTFGSLVTVVGEHGCGYEMSLEAWYRFLVDPNPPAGHEIYPCSERSSCTRPVGTDEALLAQRKAFLRPDSLLAIVMLSDENDCSIQNTGQAYFAARDIDLPRATAICDTNPNAPCCYSCLGSVPEACPHKEKPPECAGDPIVPRESDHPNLRCFEQKRRFGMDFLYPVQRYVNALKERDLCLRTPTLDPASRACGKQDLVPNPIYQDLSGAGGAVRGENMVFLAGIIGVPWQDIQADVDREGKKYPPEELHYLTAGQMDERNTWADILGEPEPGEGAAPELPRDPLMHESIAPRGGVTPSTGDALQPPSAGYMANDINGHEWDILENDDLQYACIFELAEHKECATVGLHAGCDCSHEDPRLPSPSDLRSPLCQAPDGSYSTLQRYAKAYPGLRFLHVLRDFGDNSIVASICPKNTKDERRQDFGYRPAVGAIISRLKDALESRCLPREIQVTAEGLVPCSVVEALPEPGHGCDRPGRAPASDVTIASTFARLEQLGQCGREASRACTMSDWTVCEITPSVSDTNGDDIPDCLQDEVTPGDVGWCYVDPAKGLGDEALIPSACKANERRLLRFVDRDNNTPARGAIALIACLGADLGAE